MRLTLSVYVSVERELGRSVYTCKPLRGPQLVCRDPLLSSALSKLAAQLRQEINHWTESRQTLKVNAWLVDPEMQTKILKLTLTLRDRTLKWRLLLVMLPAFGRYCAFSPSLPEIVFECQSLSDLEQRATEVYSESAQQFIADGRESEMQRLGDSADMWVEPLEVEVQSSVPAKRPSRDILAAMFGGGQTSGSEELHKVGNCLDEALDRLDSAVGRDAQIDEVDRMLHRADRPGVLLVGPPGVGKTAIIHACVRRRVAGFRGRRAERPQVWWLSPQRLISGMSYLGQWEQRWLSILREASKRDHVLYFDDLISLFSAGRTRDSSLSAADVMQSFLSENRLRILGEITSQQLAILRRRDRALADRFHLVRVPALSADDALPIILESVQGLEAASGRFFHPQVIPLVTRHQESFAPDQAFPGKAIDMLKTLAKQTTDSVVDPNDFLRLAEVQSGASRGLLLNRLGNQNSIYSALAKHLVGQPDAVAALSRVVLRYAQQLQPPDRPLGVLLFLGPTGVGKTESAKVLTRMLYHDESHLVRIDMNELTTSLAAEELVGTFEQPEGRLTAAVRRQPNCVILLDEIEKAHPDVFDYLLQVLGEGRLSDARGRVADFRSAIIIMTSNLGVAEQSSNIGFEVSRDRRAQIYVKAAQAFFRAEFYNRIDEIVALGTLQAADMRSIVQIQLEQMFSREGIKRRGVFVTIDRAAIESVVQAGYDPQLGARAVRRMLESQIMGPLGQVLSALPAGQPALLHIRHLQPARPLEVQVNPVAYAQPRAVTRLSDLQSAVEATQALVARLHQRLADMAPELQRLDASLGEQNHRASYYALREQLHRCDELRKSAIYQLSRPAAPRLDMLTQAASKPRSRVAERGPPKSVLRDWVAHQDLRSELSGGAVESEWREPQELAYKLIAGCVVANAMIEAALEPRTWMLGMLNITGRDQPDSSPSVALPAQPGLWPMSDPPSLVERLLLCLRDHWQYEISDVDLPLGFRLVSGVSLAGLIGPLLGSYQLQAEQQANQLLTLHAFPVQPNWTAMQLRQVILDAAELPHLSRLPLTSTADWLERQTERPPQEDSTPPAPSPLVICGSLGKQLVHYRSGACLDDTDEDGYDEARMLERSVKWWIDCLPVPKELEAS